MNATDFLLFEVASKLLPMTALLLSGALITATGLSMYAASQEEPRRLAREAKAAAAVASARATMAQLKDHVQARAQEREELVQAHVGTEPITIMSRVEVVRVERTRSQGSANSQRSGSTCAAA